MMANGGKPAFRFPSRHEAHKVETGVHQRLLLYRAPPAPAQPIPGKSN